MKKLLIVGSTVADVVVRVPMLPQTGEDVNIVSQRTSLGGCAYNVYQITRLLGADSTLLSPVGSGIWGDWVRHALHERGIPELLPPVDAPNGCCYCLVEPDGERTFLCEHGAEYRFRPEWFAQLPDTYDFIYICGLEIEEPTGDVLLDALEARPNALVCFAPGPRLCHISPERMARLMALHPLLHLNELEAAQFTRQDTVEEAAALLCEVTEQAVFVTLGAEGAYVYENGQGVHVPGVPARVVDTIGAGDAHIGAVMAGLARGMTLTDAAALANRVSAAVVAQSGAELTHWHEG